MTAIPNRLALLDGNRQRVGVLDRVLITDFSEADCDRLIVENVELLADALQQAGILAEGAELRVVATQFEAMDVLLAEVQNGELRRLVIVEDKLFKNPDAHRTVLAQILDYANRLQYDVSPEDVIAKASKETVDLLGEDREHLARVLRTGDFLLLVCGDRIRPRLVDLMKPFLDLNGDSALSSA